MEEDLKVHFFEKKKEYLEFEGLKKYGEDAEKFFTDNNSGGNTKLFGLAPFDRWRLISYFLLKKIERMNHEEFAQFISPNSYYIESNDNKKYFKWLTDEEIKSIHTGLGKIYGRNEIIPQTSLHKAQVIVQKKEIGVAIKKIFIVGDIHSGLPSLMSVLTAFSDENGNSIFKKDFTFNENYVIVFTGDIMDRGLLSLECIFIITQILTKNEGRVFLCRGNHESKRPMEKYGAGVEIYEEAESPDDIFLKLVGIFKKLPQVVYLIINRKRYHFSHGSFEPLKLEEFDTFMGNGDDFANISIDIPVNPDSINSDDYIEGIFDLEKSRMNAIQIKQFENLLKNTKGNTNNLWEENMVRNYGDSSSFLWGDFSLHENTKYNPRRGVKHGTRAVEKYMEKYSIKALITGHQDQFNLQIVPRVIPGDSEVTLGNFKFKKEELFTPQLIFDKNYSLINKGINETNNNTMGFFEELSSQVEPTNNYYIVTLKPGEDFDVAILSNCGFSQDRPYLVYNSFGEIII